MPTAAASRRIAAPLEDLWEVICDPHHLPRWWPRVERVEDVDEGAFTEVMRTRKGKVVRADFTIQARDDSQHTLSWRQEVEGTPFAGVLRSSETVLRLGEAPLQGAPETEVTIELRQTLSTWEPGSRVGRAMVPKIGSFMVRRAAIQTIGEALTGLERISV